MSVGETRGRGVTAGVREEGCVVCVTLTLIKHRKNSHLGDCVQPGEGGRRGREEREGGRRGREEREGREGRKGGEGREGGREGRKGREEVGEGGRRRYM